MRIILERRKKIKISYICHREDFEGECDISPEELKDILIYFNKNLRASTKFYPNIIDHLNDHLIDKETMPEFIKKFLRDALNSRNIIITGLAGQVYSKSLGKISPTDGIDFLILPGITSWDHLWLIALNKLFNNKEKCKHVNLGPTLQKTKLSNGSTSDQIQDRNSFGGRLVFSGNTDKSSFFGNVISAQGKNEVKISASAVRRFFGRKVRGPLTAYSTRHPAITELNTQLVSVKQSHPLCWNIKIGLGTFKWANRDCDGDKEVVTLMPENFLLQLEGDLFDCPKRRMICFNKTRLSFISQSIYYLFKRLRQLDELFYNIPIWKINSHLPFGIRLEEFLINYTLLYGSPACYDLYNQLCELIKDDSIIISDPMNHESKEFADMVHSGAKGTSNLLIPPERKETIKEIATSARGVLNNHIQSLMRVKRGGAAIYQSQTILMDLIVKDDFIVYKNSKRPLFNIWGAPDKITFPMDILDTLLDI